MCSTFDAESASGVVVDSGEDYGWPGRHRLVESVQRAEIDRFGDASLDAVWLDATGNLGEQLEAWWPKLKPGGCIGGPSCGYGFFGDRRRRWSTGTATEIRKAIVLLAGSSELFTGSEQNPCWFVFKAEPETERVLLVSGADGKQSASFGEQARLNHSAYARGRGYHYLWHDWDVSWKEPRHLVWAKVWVVIRALSSGEWTQVWWVDADAVFVNLQRRLSGFLHPSWSAVHPRFTDGRTMASTGVWGSRVGALPGLEDAWSRTNRGFEFYSEELCVGDSIHLQPDLWAKALLVDHRLFNGIPARGVCYREAGENFVAHLAGEEGELRREVIGDINRHLGLEPGG